MIDLVFIPVIAMLTLLGMLIGISLAEAERNRKRVHELRSDLEQLRLEFDEHYGDYHPQDV